MKTHSAIRLITLAAAFLISGLSGLQAAPSATGTFATPKSSGTFKFSAVKAVRVVSTYAYQGYFRVGTKTQPGVIYGVRPSGLGVAWHYGVSGNMAANAVLQPQADGSYSGPITFFNIKGLQTDTGTARMVFKP